jgi:integrase
MCSECELRERDGLVDDGAAEPQLPPVALPTAMQPTTLPLAPAACRAQLQPGPPSQLGELLLGVVGGDHVSIWWTLRRRRAYGGEPTSCLGTNWTMHDLRHTASLRMPRDEHLSLKDVQVILGHAHLSTTADIYSHPGELHQTGEKPQVACRERFGNASGRPVRHATQPA